MPGNFSGNSRLVGSTTPLAGSSLIRPDAISGLTLWLDSYQFVNDTDGYNITSWLDSSGNNNHANKMADGPPVVRDNLNVGNSSVYFDGYDGTDGHLQSSTSPITTSSSIFTVVRIDDRVNDGYSYIFSAGTGGALNEEGHLFKDGYFAFGAGNNSYFIRSDQRMRPGDQAEQVYLVQPAISSAFSAKTDTNDRTNQFMLWPMVVSSENLTNYSGKEVRGQLKGVFTAGTGTGTSEDIIEINGQQYIIFSIARQEDTRFFVFGPIV